MSRRDKLRIELERLLACALAPVLLCRPTVDGKCSAPWHGTCGRQAGKRPLVGGFGIFAEEPPTLDDLAAVTRRIWPVNVGVVTGNRVIAVEADSPEAEDELVGMLGSAINTPTRRPRPGRGRAWLVHVPAGHHMRNRAKLGACGAIDVRGHNGLLVVPPSRHVTGHLYTWEVAPWDRGPAVIPHELFRFVTKDHASATRTSTPSVARYASCLVSPTARVLAMIAARPALARLWRGEGKRGGDQSASGYDCSLAVHLLHLRVPPDEVAVAVAARSGAHRHDSAYAQRTVDNAMRLVSRRRP